MDPLSISVSAVTLIQVAASVTKTLRGFKHSIKNIDARIEDLCGELDRLTVCLKTVQETLDTCQRLDLASVGETLWQQCDVAISDCNMTLSAMSIMAEKIGSTAKRRGFMGKTKAVVDWSEHSTDLSAFRDKIHKSQLALQTMLQTITVSTSLRSQDSLELVHLKLDVLKRSIEDALGATLRPAGGLSYSDSDIRLTHNLRKLLNTVKQFHSAASSTASTIRDGTSGSWMAHGDRAMSLMGDFPPTRRQWVEDYVRAGPHQRRQSPDSSGQRTPYRAVSPRRPRSPTGSHCATSFAAIDSITVKTPAKVVPAQEDGPRQSEEKQEEDEISDDDNDGDGDGEGGNDSDNAEAEAEAEQAFRDRIHELAMDRIRSRDYSTAVAFLQRALKLEPLIGSTRAKRRRLQIQLSVCHFLQGEWKKAEVLVLALSRTKTIRDSVTCTLLHALSLAHLFHYSFDQALKIGQRALQGRKRLSKVGSIDPNEVDETRALLATIYDVRGGDDDYIRADVFSGQLAEGFRYDHPTGEIAFLTDHPTLLSIVFGGDSFAFGLTTHIELPGDIDSCADSPMVARQPSTLRRRPTVSGGSSPLSVKLTDHWRYEQDTNKVAISMPEPTSRPLPPENDTCTDADDELSPTIIDTPTSPIRHRLTCLLSSRRSKPVRLEDAPEAVPNSSEPPTTITSPASRWLRSGGAFGLAKSRNLLRRRPNEDVLKRLKRPKSFRLLGKTSTPQVTTVSEEEADPRIMDWLKRQPSNKNDADCASVVAHIGSSRSPSPEPTCDYFGPDSLSGQFTPPFTSFDEVATFAEYMSRGAPKDPRVLEEMGITVETARNWGIQPIGDSLCHELMDTSPLQGSRDTRLSPRHVSPLGVGPREDRRECDPALTSPSSLRPRRPALSLQLPAPRKAVDIYSVLGQLAGLFAAIPAMTDGNERRAAKSTLLRLLPYVWNDPVLVDDMRRVIKALEEKDGHGIEDASDSGYETMVTADSPKSPSEPNSVVESERNDSLSPLPCPRIVTPKDEHRRSPIDKPVSPVLKRAFSFVAGAEDVLCWRRPGVTEEGDKDEAPQSSKKQVSFALGPDHLDELHTSDSIRSESEGKESDETSSGSIKADEIGMEDRKLPKDCRQRNIGEHEDFGGNKATGRKAFWRGNQVSRV